MLHYDTLYIVVNVALLRPTWQSSTAETYNASLATDGSTLATLAYCAQTLEETDPWWLVDLGREFLVRSVQIQNSEYNRELKLFHCG